MRSHLLSWFLIHREMADILVGTNLRGTLLEHFQRTSRLSSLILPLGTTVDTSYSSAHLASSPLLETIFVEVLTASGLAPHDLLVRFHVEDTDRTLAFDGLANDLTSWERSCNLMLAEVRSAGNWCVGKYLLQLLGEEC